MEPGDQPRTVEVDGMELHLDPDPDAVGEAHTALPPRLESWRRRSVAGAILTGIGLGLKEALEPQRDEPAVMIEASGEPPTPLPVEADLGGILPGDNVVRIRPWLLSGGVAESAATDAGGLRLDDSGGSPANPANSGNQASPVTQANPANSGDRSSPASPRYTASPANSGADTQPPEERR